MCAAQDRVAAGRPHLPAGAAGPGAEAVPPLSDYAPFWRRRVPFLFLTGGRWRHYHTPEDTPDATGRLPESSRGRLQMLLLGLEQGLA